MESPHLELSAESSREKEEGSAGSQERRTWHDARSDEGTMPVKECPPHDETEAATGGDTGTMEPPSQQIFLKEFAPLVHILNQIPQHAQRGLNRVDVKLTCLDVISEYLAIGSNVGVVFLYDRHKNTVERLSCSVSGVFPVLSIWNVNKSDGTAKVPPWKALMAVLSDLVGGGHDGLQSLKSSLLSLVHDVRSACLHDGLDV